MLPATISETAFLRPKSTRVGCRNSATSPMPKPTSCAKSARSCAPVPTPSRRKDRPPRLRHRPPNSSLRSRNKMSRAPMQNSYAGGRLRLTYLSHSAERRDIGCCKIHRCDRGLSRLDTASVAKSHTVRDFYHANSQLALFTHFGKPLSSAKAAFEDEQVYYYHRFTVIVHFLLVAARNLHYSTPEAGGEHDTPLSAGA